MISSIFKPNDESLEQNNTILVQGLTFSSNIDQLALALSKFHGESTNVERLKKAHKYKYADLGQVLDMATPLLHTYELALTQFPISSGRADHIGLATMLMHSSGQWMNGYLEMPIAEQAGLNTPQAIGSLISYMRRYTISGVLGIAQEDTDANPVNKTVGDNLESNGSESFQGNYQQPPKKVGISAKQLDILNKAYPVGSLGYETILKKCNINSLDELSSQDASLYVGHVFKNKEQQNAA